MVNKEILNDMKSSENYFIFVQENSQKVKKVKNLFNAEVLDFPEDNKIKVSFDVSTAVGGAVDAGGTCRMWPNEPTVTIALTE